MCDSDMYFYVFVMPDHPNGANVNSEQRTMVESIEHWDREPLMDTQIVVTNARRMP
jgi:hypothetical protein